MRKYLFIFGLAMLLDSCISIKKQELWEIPKTENLAPKIGNFYGLNIAREGLSSEVWFTQNPRCLQISTVTETVFEGEKALFLKWDKQAGNCEWLGMGIGWDAWSGKNLSGIVNKAAIQFKAYSKSGKVKSLPLAIALEDYGGLQAWLGLFPQYIEHKENEEWATVTLPLFDFDWDQFNADAGNIKQMIIQFEASGEVYFDEIKLVQYDGNLKKKYTISALKPSELSIDKVDELLNQGDMMIFEDNSKLAVRISNNQMVLLGQVMDNSPLQNGQSDENIWNGDGIEFAISTSTDANPRRKNLLFSDQHIGVKMGAEQYVFDYKRKNRWDQAKVETKKSSTGYYFLVTIPYELMRVKNWDAAHTYQMEVAINKGNQQKREQQLRWNSEKQEGFHQNPTLWGLVNFDLKQL